MEYRLNKIDPDLRRKIIEITKEGKVHRKESTIIDKDREDNNKKNKKKYVGQLKKNRNTIIINAVKTESVQVDAVMDEISEGKESKGMLLDVLK